jgi:hypothetical protein
MPNSSPEPDFLSKTVVSERDPRRERLDNLVVNIELTLTSIIQGVALSFLCANATEPLIHLRLDQVLYVLNALLLIFLFWARSIGHTLTVIRWPLDFSHNFFYFAAAFVESVAFTHITDPAGWYALLALFSAIVWSVFVFDTRLIRRVAQCSDPPSAQLLSRLHRDQQQNICWIVPLLFCFHGGAAALILRFPDLFIKDQFHIVLGVLQFFGFVGYLIYLVRFLARLGSMIEPDR